MKIEELQILAQLIDSTNSAIEKIEHSYGKNDVEEFAQAKQTILNFNKKISEIIEKNDN
ncbi:MAG: hypothetical protein AABW67_03630 [Nanoarchaeota archaeon]